MKGSRRFLVLCVAVCSCLIHPKQRTCAAQADSESLQLHLVRSCNQQLFEDIPVSLICIANSTLLSSVTWVKDGEEVGTCDQSGESHQTIPGNLTDSSVVTAIAGEQFHCTLKIQQSTIIDHRGTYHCNGSLDGGNTINSDSYELIILERRPFCQASFDTVPFDGPHEYLVGDLLIFKCYNPFYDPPRDVQLMVDPGPVSISPNLANCPNTSSSLAALVEVTEDLNGSIFSCSALPEGGSSAMPLSEGYSCSLGPLRVFDSPFLTIEEVPDGTTRTLRCRLYPWRRGVNLTWSLDEGVGSLESTQEQGDIYSYLTFTSDTSDSLDFNITCTGWYEGEFYTATHFVNVTGRPSVNPTADPPSEGGLPAFVIPSAAIGGFILICVVIFLVIIVVSLRRRCRRIRESTSEQQQGNDKLEHHGDDLSVSGDETRYEVEPRAGDGRYVNQKPEGYENHVIELNADGGPEDGGPDYDLPPFGMQGLPVDNDSAEGNQESYATVGPHSDPSDGEVPTWGFDPGDGIQESSFIEGHGCGDGDGVFQEDYSTIGPYHDSAATGFQTVIREDTLYDDAA